MTTIVLAGGNDQIALLNELRRRGHYTILVDCFQEPVAKPFADKHIVASTLDVDAVTEIAEREHADLVVTACTDQALLTMAKVSETLHLPCYISYETAKNVTNKLHMKQKFVEGGIPTARHIMTTDTKINIPRDFKYPLVVKPVDCNSSKGVKLCQSEDILRENIKDALNLSRTSAAIIEEYKHGTEISADFFVENGKANLLCATQSKKIKNVNSFTITQSYYPALTAEQENEVTKIGQQIATTFNLKNCPMLVQIIINNDGQLFVLEFSARMGGGSKYKLIEVLTGVDIMKAFVDLALDKMPELRVLKQVKYASLNYVYCNNGIFHQLRGFENLLFFQYASNGTSVTKAETSSDRIAGFLLTADTSCELVEKTRITNSKIQVLDINGNDFMRHDLIEESL